MPYKVVRDFEAQVAEYAGAKYGVAVESGTAAIFLSIQYRKFVEEQIKKDAEKKGQSWTGIGSIGEVSIPKRTYPSVPCAIIQAGGKVKFTDYKWEGSYQLYPLLIFDSALRFKRGMCDFLDQGLYCLSFHVKKLLPIGRGGMILTNDEVAAAWLRKARFDGRDECDLNAPQTFTLGWNMYMTPEQAARGLQLLSIIKNGPDPEDLPFEAQGYPDLSLVEAYR